MTIRLQFLIVCLFVCGCGSGPTIAPVTGRVTFNGEPLAKASVQFLPMAEANSIEAPGPGSTGVTDENGNYTLKLVTGNTIGAVVGNHRVVIYTAFSSQRSDSGGGKEKLPAKYNSATELSFTVKTGQENVADWTLKGE